MEELPRQRDGSENSWRLMLPLFLAISGWLVASLLCTFAVLQSSLYIGSLAGAAAVVLGLLAVLLSRSDPQIWRLGGWGAWRAKWGDDAGPSGGSDSREHEEYAARLEKRLAERTRMLADAYRDMKSVERAKEAFLSNVSHELRTPLTSIMAAEEILSRFAADSPEDRGEFLAIIRQESNHLLEIIDKLMDLAKLEARALRLDYERVHVEQLARESTASILERRPDLSTRLAITGPGEPVLCECDRQRIARVLHSMVENAVRFAPNGSRVGLQVAAQGDWVVVTVRDRGAYSEERFADLFQGEGVDDPADSQTLPFVGFPIAERLAALHGGRVDAAPTGDGGTVVTLRLPKRAETPVVAAAAPAEAGAARGSDGPSPPDELVEAGELGAS